MDCLWLASQASLISRKGHSLIGDAICGNIIARWDSYDVADHKLFGIEGHNFSVTNNSSSSYVLLGL